MATWNHVTVGVENLDAALEIWVDLLGFEVRQRRDGPDPGLATLWELPGPDAVQRQAMLGSPGLETGLLHLVQFADPDAPVRAGANVFDLLPKNLDLHARNLPERVAELRAAGMQFRTDEHSEVVAPSGTTFREIHMFGHDDTNIVFIEVIGDEIDFNDKGFAGIAPLITIVPDAPAEEKFFRDMLGLKELSHNLLEGPEVEKMVGLPPGSGLDVYILGREGEEFGLMEVIEYRGVEGEDRYPRARPPALGTLHVSYLVDDLTPLLDRLDAAGVPVQQIGPIETLFGRGPAAVFYSPAGLRVEAHQRN